MRARPWRGPGNSRAILVADIVGYSRLAGVDEDRTLSRLRGLRSDLIDPAIDAHHGRIVKRTGDGALVDFRSVVDAVRCAIDVQNGLAERNGGLPPERRIEFRVGIHLGDVVEEADGDLMGDGVNIAARLEGIAKPGAICLSEQAYWQVKGRPDIAATDLGPTQLKNIAEPIRVYSLEVGKPGQAKSAKPAASMQRSMLVPFAVGIAALLIMILAGSWYFVSANRPATVAVNPPAPIASTAVAPAQAAHLSIVVLPFTNLSGDPSQDYFADGITENLTTELSRINNSFVIARNTAFTFKGKSIDAKEIGKELGVRYVLEGSVQRDQNRVRVNAQLVDAETGAQLWADRFAEDVADLFKLQDQVVVRLANTLGLELVKAEAEKSARSKNPDAIDLTMRGRALQWQWWWRQRTKDNNDRVRALYEQALKIDPTEADALAGEALTYAIDYAWEWTNPETNYVSKILDQADQAIALDPDNVTAYYAKSTYLQYTGRWNDALRVLDAGLAMNPSSATLYASRTIAENNLGRFEQAKSDAQQAMRLSPRDPQMGWWHVVLGDAELGLGHFDAAVEEYRMDLDVGNHTDRYIDIAAAYALEGKMDEAKSALAEARRLNPKLSAKSLERKSPAIPLWWEGLRKAGLPLE
jgi:adenylate cyclase